MGCGLNCKQTKTFTTDSWNIDVYPVVVSIIQEPTLIKSLKWDVIASFIYIINSNLAHFYGWSWDGRVATECFQHDPELQLFTRALQQGTEPKIASEAMFLWININNWVFKLSVPFISVCMKASLKEEMDDWNGEAVLLSNTGKGAIWNILISGYCKRWKSEVVILRTKVLFSSGHVFQTNGRASSLNVNSIGILHLNLSIASRWLEETKLIPA